MPAPLGKTPTRKMPDIQVFGRDDSRRRGPRSGSSASGGSSCTTSTSASGRSPPASCGGSRSGSAPRALLDETSRPYRDAGLAYLTLDDAGIVAAAAGGSALLRLPLVRHGNEVTVGPAEATWAALAQACGGALNAVQPTTAPTTTSTGARRSPTSGRRP